MTSSPPAPGGGPPVLVTGGTGFVGAHVVRALVRRGRSVRCLVRAGGGRRNLDGLAVARVEGDLREPDTLRHAIDGCGTLFHCAADYRLWAPDPQEIYRTNVEGTANVLRAAAEAGVARVVYTSSVGALGLRPDARPADETTPVALADMVGHYKRSKFLAERVAEEWIGRGLDVVMVHPSTPVGELDAKPTPTGQVIVDYLNRRIPAYVETGLNLVDVRDVAEGHLLAETRGVTGERYILGNRNLELREIFELLETITGIPAPTVKLPYWVPWTVAALGTGWARLTGRPPRVPLESVRMSKKTMFFDSGKAVAELGLPQRPVKAALERAVSWFREHGYAPA